MRVWAIGDVLPEVGKVRGGTQLILYESAVDVWLQQRRATVICQYDARAFDGQTLLGILRLHPLLLANRRVAENPFYQAPDKCQSN